MNKVNKSACKIIISMLFVILIIGSSLVVSAEEYETNAVEPRYTSINLLSCNLSLADGNTGATGVATKKSSASSIEGTLVVYEQNGNDWIKVDEAYKSVTRGSLAVQIDFVAESGVTYKAEWTVTAYTNGVGETVVIEDIKTCP